MSSSSDTTPTFSYTTTLTPHELPPCASTTEPTDSRLGPSTGINTTTVLTPHPDMTVEALLLTICQVVRDEIAAAGSISTSLPLSSSVTVLLVGPPSITGTTKTDAPFTRPGISTSKLCHSTHILRLVKPTPVAAHHISRKPTLEEHLTSHTGTYISSLPCMVAHLNIQDFLSYTMNLYSHMTHTHISPLPHTHPHRQDHYAFTLTHDIQLASTKIKD